MKDSILLKKTPFYCSWTALSIFVFLLIFQPLRMTFYAMRPSDGWLLFCLVLQIKNGYNNTIYFKNRYLIKYYGLFLGILAIIATLTQASYANLNLDPSYLFHFYRFLRFLFIFKFAENICHYINQNDLEKYLIVYTLMGILVLFLSMLEYNNIMPFKLVIFDQYYNGPESSFEAYFIDAERLVGVMGNPNATAILIVSTLPFPLIKILKTTNLISSKSLYLAYVLFVVYVLVVMTASRTSIFILIIIPLLIFIAISRNLKEVLIFFVFAMFIIGIGNYAYHSFEDKIKVQDRISQLFTSKSLQFSAKGLGEWTGRDWLWQDRLRTFESKGNQLSILLGLGYTKAYEDYADNGFLSTFVNNGLIGLVLKLLLFFIFLVYGLIRTLINYRQKKTSVMVVAAALTAISFLLWELTADMIEHYKLGQLFYIFLSVVLTLNSKEYITDKQ